MKPDESTGTTGSGLPEGTVDVVRPVARQPRGRPRACSARRLDKQHRDEAVKRVGVEATQGHPAARCHGSLGVRGFELRQRTRLRRAEWGSSCVSRTSQR